MFVISVARGRPLGYRSSETWRLILTQTRVEGGIFHFAVVLDHHQVHTDPHVLYIQLSVRPECHCR